MRHTVTGLVDKPMEAQRLIEELMSRCLCDRSDIHLLAQDTAALSARMGSSAARAAEQLASAAGSAASATVSGVGRVASAAAHFSPGGVLRAAGELSATLARTMLGTAEELARSFVDFGIGEQLAREYAEALRAGKILVVVDAKTENQARCARQVLATQGVSQPAGAAT